MRLVAVEMVGQREDREGDTRCSEGCGQATCGVARVFAGLVLTSSFPGPTVAGIEQRVDRNFAFSPSAERAYPDILVIPDAPSQ